MFIGIDIGNTNIVVGFFKNERLIRTSRFSVLDNLEDNFNSSLRKDSFFCKFAKEVHKPVIISSVVPSVVAHMKNFLEKEYRLDILVAGKDINVPIKNLYKKKKDVGQDRLVNAYSCLHYYSKPAIIVDFGTATTFDYIDTRGSYAGGLITPGIEISLNALAEKTALLPKISLKEPKQLIGTSTVESIRSGVTFGLAALCDGIVEKIRKRYSKRAFVIATGGLSDYFSVYCKNIDEVDKDLTLKGLWLLSLLQEK
ncbi:MAG: type III pantothenate kinase [Candidatus Omnitrophota bacterium]